MSAHPDDADFYCGGTLARWIREGAEVRYVICTNAELGSDDPKTDPAALAALRKEEQTAANRALGVLDTTYLGYPDTGLKPTDELRVEIARLIRMQKPHALVTFDPWLHYEIHPDHTAAGLSAVYARHIAKLPLYKNDLIDNDSLPFWAVEHLYMMKPDRPNTWIDIEDFLKIKAETLLCHNSQFGMLYSSPEQGEALIREMSHKHPESGRAAEPFRYMPLEGIKGIKAYISL